MNNSRTSESLQRTILYYPTISVPSGSWLRQALLYFDSVASIVPQRVRFSGEAEDTLISLSPDIEFLLAEGVFKPIPPEHLFMKSGWELAHNLAEEFRSTVSNNIFRQQLEATKQERNYVKVHRDKLSDTTLSFLEQQQLVKFDAPDDQKYQAEWFQVEENTALLYMSLLAKYLADTDIGMTVPGTDRPEYERLIYGASSKTDGFACLNANLLNVLPIPQNDTPLNMILDFRRKRRAELLHFRDEFDKLLQELSKTVERSETKRILISTKESLERELNDLTNLLRESKLSTTMGCLKAMINLESPKLWASLGVASLSGTVGSVSIALAGLITAGAIEIGCYLVDKRNERRAKLRSSPFAYLYHAKSEALI